MSVEAIKQVTNLGNSVISSTVQKTLSVKDKDMEYAINLDNLE